MWKITHTKYGYEKYILEHHEVSNRLNEACLYQTKLGFFYLNKMFREGAIVDVYPKHYLIAYYEDSADFYHRIATKRKILKSRFFKYYDIKQLSIEIQKLKNKRGIK